MRVKTFPQNFSKQSQSLFFQGIKCLSLVRNEDWRLRRIKRRRLRRCSVNTKVTGNCPGSEQRLFPNALNGRVKKVIKRDTLNEFLILNMENEEGLAIIYPKSVKDEPSSFCWRRLNLIMRPSGYALHSLPTFRSLIQESRTSIQSRHSAFSIKWTLKKKHGCLLFVPLISDF